MFTIIGGDGKEYGPVTSEQVWTWLNSGRANLQTKARRVGADEWRSLGEFPEFGSATAEAGPPPLVGAAPTPGYSAPPAAPSAIPLPSNPEDFLASRGLRLLAVIIDSFLGSMTVLPGFIVLGMAFLRVAMSGQYGDVGTIYNSMAAGRLLLGIALLFFLPVILLIVQVWMLAIRGQTIGKRLVAIRIVKYPERVPVGIVHAWLLRAVVPGIIMLFPYVGFLFFIVDTCFIFRPDKRCVHDLIAGTQMIKV